MQLECSGEGREPAGDSFPKSVRSSRTFQCTYLCLPQAHLSLQSSALVFNIFPFFFCVACVITSCLKSHVRGGRGWTDGQKGRLPPLWMRIWDLGRGKFELQLSRPSGLWDFG